MCHLDTIAITTVYLMLLPSCPLRNTIMPFTPLIAVGFDNEPLVVLRASDKGDYLAPDLFA